MAVELWAMQLERPLTAEETEVLTALLPTGPRARLERIWVAARRQEPVSRRALERADSRDDSDIWKYVREFSTTSRLPKSDDSGTLDPR